MFSASPISEQVLARMVPTSWREGCPVPLESLAYIQVTHWDFGGVARTGELVVHADVVEDLRFVFASLFDARFPIRRMELVDNYGGSDFASIEADNTSAMNCRSVEGTNRWSQHAFGRAIDINPIENPYVAGGRTSHGASVPFLDRTAGGLGTIGANGPVTAAFASVGWGWGGNWASPKDYQHFSKSGN